MSRLDTIKRVGFPVEPCPKCLGEDSDCEVCSGTGEFKQLLHENWEPPVLNPGERLVAYLDGGFWVCMGVVNSSRELVLELDFPFATNYAEAEHFETIGFKVVST